jgi:hypothetical protein
VRHDRVRRSEANRRLRSLTHAESSCEEFATPAGQGGISGFSPKALMKARLPAHIVLATNTPTSEDPRLMLGPPPSSAL